MSKMYIKREPVTILKLTCDHPKVKRIWEYGGGATMPTSALLIRTIAIQFEDGTVKEFSDNGISDSAVQDAENYLQSIQ